MTHWRKKGYFERMWWKIRNPLAWGRVLNMDELRRKREFDEMRENFARSTGRDYEKEYQDLLEYQRRHPDEHCTRYKTIFGER